MKISTSFQLLFNSSGSAESHVNRLNRQVEYALMALKVMALKPQGSRISAKEIADSTGAPFDPTARVLQQLKQKGLLKVEQGAQGGYSLGKNLEDISFYDLAETVMGPIGVARCLHSEENCELKETCNIFSPIHALNRKVEDFYRSLNLAEILEVEALK